MDDKYGIGYLSWFALNVCVCIGMGASGYEGKEMAQNDRERYVGMTKQKQNKNYLEGVRAAQEFYNCKHFAWVHTPVRGIDAMRFFWPPVKEMNTMVSSPLPQDRQQWIKGFEEEQANILIDRENEQ